MPAVIAKITNEIAACVKMNAMPCRMEDRIELAAPAGATDLRSIERVRTMAAEKKKLALSSKKHKFAPNHCTSRPAMAGLTICEPWTAWDIRALTAINPVAGASVRTATDCAGMKKLDTALSTKKTA